MQHHIPKDHISILTAVRTSNLTKDSHSSEISTKETLPFFLQFKFLINLSSYIYTAGYCKHCTQPLGSIKGSRCYLLKKDSSPFLNYIHISWWKENMYFCKLQNFFYQHYKVSSTYSDLSTTPRQSTGANWHCGYFFSRCFNFPLPITIPLMLHTHLQQLSEGQTAHLIHSHIRSATKYCTIEKNQSWYLTDLHIFTISE